MPVMDGLEATTRLRQAESAMDQSLPRQFVIAFSANSDHVSMVEAYAAGVDDFISKPFAIQTLYACYDKHVHKSTNKDGK